MNNEQENENFGKLVFSGKESELQKKIDQGIDLNQVVLKGMTPLILAIEGDQPRILELLLKNGANPNKQSNIDGLTPLHWAVDYAVDGMTQNNRDTSHPEPIECVRTLLKYGADINIKDNSGKKVSDYPMTKEILDELQKLK